MLINDRSAGITFQVLRNYMRGLQLFTTIQIVCTAITPRTQSEGLGYTG